MKHRPCGVARRSDLANWDPFDFVQPIHQQADFARFDRDDCGGPAV